MPDEKEAVYAAAIELIQQRPCPGCGGVHLRIPAKLHILMEQFDSPSPTESIQVRAMQVVPVTCNGCGLVRLFDTSVLEDPEAQDPQNRV
ncbi:MAG: hypothetical protein ABGY41_11170 [Candidatus Poribacteria bacterium]|jgi:hypothetical protein